MGLTVTEDMLGYKTDMERNTDELRQLQGRFNDLFARYDWADHGCVWCRVRYTVFGGMLSFANAAFLLAASGTCVSCTQRWCRRPRWGPAPCSTGWLTCSRSAPS